MNEQELQALIESWGAMGALWGINRSMARVHALLITSEVPVSLDEVAERLEISRGNASMCLKELRSWGVIKRLYERGDRRDYYVTEPDIWSMFFRILGERKKREFDPVLTALNATLEPTPAGAEPDNSPVRARLEQMRELLSTLDKLASRFLSDEKSSKAMLDFLVGMGPR